MEVTCRELVYNRENRTFLISRISDSLQEQDLRLPPNCNGFGRIRHFKRFIDTDWGYDPLPIDPAIKALNLETSDILLTQVFQIAICNANCWYCFVPNELKCGDSAHAAWFTAKELVQLYISEHNYPLVLDLSGGNPELVPEWIIDTMKALEHFGVSDKVYLWSDDTLTTDFTFSLLSSEDIAYMQQYPNYGKVCCFKGFDSESFSFNTGLQTEKFKKQFDLFSLYFDLGIDIYGYVTFTTPSSAKIKEHVREFIEMLQRIHPLLPLRIVPLKIKAFTPVLSRLNEQRRKSLENQIYVYQEWDEQLHKNYSSRELATNIAEVKLRK